MAVFVDAELNFEDSEQSVRRCRTEVHLAEHVFVNAELKVVSINI